MRTTQKYALAITSTWRSGTGIYLKISEVITYLDQLLENDNPLIRARMLNDLTIIVYNTITGQTILKIDPTKLYNDGYIPPQLNNMLSQHTTLHILPYPSLLLNLF